MQTIRDYMKKNGYDAIVVPTADAHQNEYPAEAYRLRAHLSGFTGSAGTLVVTQENAGLWTDGRYELQAEKQLAGTGIDLYCTAYPNTTTIEQFLRTLPEEATVAIDGGRMSVSEYRRLKRGIAAKLVSTLDSDALWPDAPPLPGTKLEMPASAAAGGTVSEKLERLRAALEEKNADATFIGASEDIAWLLNLRGADTPGTPIFYAYAWVSAEDAVLFVPEEKLTEPIRQALTDAGVEISSYESALGFLQKNTQSVLLDPDRTNVTHYQAVDEVLRMDEQNPTTPMKAKKTKEEIDCLKEAYRKDGLALTAFFHWLEQHGAGHTEYEVGEKLRAFREEQPGFSEPSFDTIAGYGPNGAIIHYRAEEDSARIENKSLLLLDSGGQYDTGTTDITRTVAMGELTREEKRDYTLTLKSHIALASAHFLEGAQGVVLDGFARYPLWQEGIDYKHGTGHGIGFMLSVHEGPMGISRQVRDTPIEPGHVLSIEPGIYRAGKHGIRIENIGVVEKCEETEFGSFLCFDMLSYCFIDTRPLDLTLLSPQEKEWLNTYHRKVYELLAPDLTDELRGYLKERTRPVY